MTSAPWWQLTMASPGAPPRLTTGETTSEARASGANAQTTAPWPMTFTIQLTGVEQMQDAVTSALTKVLSVIVDLTSSRGSMLVWSTAASLQRRGAPRSSGQAD